MLTPRTVPRLWREATSPGTRLCLIKERDKIMGVGGGGVRFWESKSLQPQPIPSLCANQPFRVSSIILPGHFLLPRSRHMGLAETRLGMSLDHLLLAPSLPPPERSASRWEICHDVRFLFSFQPQQGLRCSHKEWSCAN